MKVDDLVRHTKKTNYIGIVVEVNQGSQSALINLSNSEGVLFGWIRLNNLIKLKLDNNRPLQN
jgi:hypothetical protein